MKYLINTLILYILENALRERKISIVNDIVIDPNNKVRMFYTHMLSMTASKDQVRLARISRTQNFVDNYSYLL